MVLSEGLDEVIRDYVRGFNEEPSTARGRNLVVLRFNPEYQSLGDNYSRFANRLELIDREFDSNPRLAQDCIDVALQVNDGYRSGLALGYIFAEQELDLEAIAGSDEFKEGVHNGQIYGLKALPNNFKRFLLMGAAGVGICSQLPSDSVMAPENIELYQAISQFSTPAFMGFGLYGLAAMLTTKLLGNDTHISKTLITNGPFAIHRNPFYAAALAAVTSAMTKPVALEVLSEKPNILKIGLLLASVGCFYLGLRDNASSDEAVLEKTFGQEYLDYKKRTPRFFPAFWNLFKMGAKTE